MLLDDVIVEASQNIIAQDLDTSVEMETRTAAVAQLECDSPYSTVHGSDEETLRFCLCFDLFTARSTSLAVYKSLFSNGG